MAIQKGALRAAIDTSGDLWMVDGNANVWWRKSGGHWALMSGAAMEIATGADGSIWMLETNVVSSGYRINRWTDRGWGRLPDSEALIDVSVGPDGAVWGVNNKFEIWRRLNGNWSKIDGAAFDVAIGLAGTAWAIGTDQVGENFGIYSWQGGRWKKEAGGAAGRTVVVDAEGTPWVSNARCEIYRRRPGGYWERLPGAAAGLTSDALGNVWAIGPTQLPGGFSIYRWIGDRWLPQQGPPKGYGGPLDSGVIMTSLIRCTRDLCTAMGVAWAARNPPVGVLAAGAGAHVYSNQLVKEAIDGLARGEKVPPRTALLVGQLT